MNSPLAGYPQLLVLDLRVAIKKFCEETEGVDDEYWDFDELLSQVTSFVFDRTKLETNIHDLGKLVAITHLEGGGKVTDAHRLGRATSALAEVMAGQLLRFGCYTADGFFPYEPDFIWVDTYTPVFTRIQEDELYKLYRGRE